MGEWLFTLAVAAGAGACVALITLFWWLVYCMIDRRREREIIRGVERYLAGRDETPPPDAGGDAD